ncbi:helix-turn-helix domain-containing protein [Paracoccaceae bacterium]|nr:helix-turn-helix domain-containing protein [Paracoccaceae bacterium]
MPASLTNPVKAATDYNFSRQSKPAYRNTWIRAVCGDDSINGPSNHVAHLLNYFVNSKSGLCCPAQDTLAKTGGISVSTVKRSLTTLEQAGYIHRVKAVKRQHTYNCYFLLQPDRSLEEVMVDDSLVDDRDVFVSTTAQRELQYPPNHSSHRPLVTATIAQRDPYGGSERTNNIRNNLSSEILIFIDDKEDLISSAAPRTFTSADISKEETTTEKTEPRKLGEVRFEDMFGVKDQEQRDPIGTL